MVYTYTVFPVHILFQKRTGDNSNRVSVGDKLVSLPRIQLMMQCKHTGVLSPEMNVTRLHGGEKPWTICRLMVNSARISTPRQDRRPSAATVIP